MTFCKERFVERPNEFIYFSASVSVACKGVYPNAVVMSDEDKEKIAESAFVPCLFNVNTLLLAAASEKEMLDTKLLATVSVALKGVYPRAVVIVKGVKAKLTGKVVPSFLAIEKL